MGGEWGWETRTVQSGLAAAWENPGRGFTVACLTYANMQTCQGLTGEPDLMFALRGKES